MTTCDPGTIDWFNDIPKLKPNWFALASCGSTAISIKAEANANLFARVEKNRSDTANRKGSLEQIDGKQELVTFMGNNANSKMQSTHLCISAATLSRNKIKYLHPRFSVIDALQTVNYSDILSVDITIAALLKEPDRVWLCGV